MPDREGFVPEVAGTSTAARAAYRRATSPCILLDVMLPDGDGRDSGARSGGSDVPIVMLTARGEEIDRVVGLELGADDYVVKPFSARELAARIRAIRARSRRRAGGPIAIGEIALDPASRTVTKRRANRSSSPRRSSTCCTC